jgi:NTP pyrophosphatase (non-canonical NTP hydrolase)
MMTTTGIKMEVINKIVQWHKDRNLIEGSDDRSQFSKLLEEVRELAVSIETDNSPVDDIGDIVVVLINIAERNGLSLEQCLEHAYNDIKDRKGKMIDGVFVKDVLA